MILISVKNNGKNFGKNGKKQSFKDVFKTKKLLKNIFIINF